ncbi:PH domain-containing protein [Metabacillus sp. RGM 3146]|uniref:PH domain-containing protein n=1 Tax=Metabacillus sp. RGM 3146 TaxID=3401092 RepID=UPI003B9D5AD7
MMMSEPNRLHPVVVILNFIKRVKDMIIPLVVFLFFNGARSMPAGWKYAGVGVFILILVIFSVLSWLKFTYRIENGELRVENGIFVNKKRYIPVERIQTVHVNAGLVQQAFGLVRLQAETAGGGKEAEVVLEAIHKKKAEEIWAVLYRKKQEIENAELVLEKPADRLSLSKKEAIYKLSGRDLLFGAATSSGIGVVLSAAAAFASQIDDIIPWQSIFSKFEFLSNASLALYAFAVFIGFVLAWIVSMLGVILKYASFTIVKNEKELIISRGLLEKNQLTIPLARIQAVKISEGILRQPFGYASVHLFIAGGGTKGEKFSATLFPFVKKSQIPSLLMEFAPSYTLSSELIKVSPKARARYIFGQVLPALILIIPLCIFLRPWGYLSLVFFIAAVFLGLQAHKDAGWSLKGKQLSLSSRVFSKTTVLVLKQHMQTFRVDQSFFQKRRDLTTINTSIISGFTGAHISLIGLDAKQALKIENWFSRRTIPPRRPMDKPSSIEEEQFPSQP